MGEFKSSSFNGDVNINGSLSVEGVTISGLSLDNMITAKEISTLPTEHNNLTWSALQTINSNIPQYAKGIHICNGGNDAVLMGVDYVGNFIYGHRNNGVWENSSFRSIGTNKVLWSGACYMDASHTITLSEAISSQVHGIVMVWSSYWSSAAQDDNFHYVFIPKQHVTDYSGKLVISHLQTGQLATIATKGVYIADTAITGHDDNTAVVTSKNFNGAAFVLRKVLGI